MWSDAGAVTGRAPLLDHTVAFLAASWHVRQRDVRQLEQDRTQLPFGGLEVTFEPRNFLSQVPTARDQLIGGLLRLLASRDFLRIVVSCCFALLDSLDQGTPL